MPRPRPVAPIDSPDEIEQQFYEALQRGDIERLMAVWSDDEEIVCVPPGGGRVVGAAAIRAAEEVGANRVPQAQLHLQLAKEQSEQAKKMIDNDGDREQAGLILARAEADANLALALARSSQEQQQAQVAMDKVRGLKTQNGEK